MAAKDLSACQPDIVIYGGGIAGLWLLHALKARGYDVLLLERDSIGGGQTIAAQGIIHSGLKFSLAGHVSKLAQSISAMPDIWHEALRGENPVDLRQATLAAQSQLLLMPPGITGGIVQTIAQGVLGKGASRIKESEWPQGLKESGFKGTAIHMSEPVLDVPSVVRVLTARYADCIRRGDENTPEINAKLSIFTAAASNHEIARIRQHDKGLKTQKRPLLMGMMRPAPFPLFAHLTGASDKPICTITTHKDSAGRLIWYLGALVAERPKEADPHEVFDAARDAFERFFPDLPLENLEWAVWPIDRVEGASTTDGWMPDTPTLHLAGDSLYCWPTKLTFAPLLAQRVLETLHEKGLSPSGKNSDFSALPAVAIASPPWDMAVWRSYQKGQNT